MDVDHKNASATNGGGENFSSNATDVTDLQREKAQVELQMLRLKSNINAIEFQLNHNERVSQFFEIFFSIVIRFLSDRKTTIIAKSLIKFRKTLAKFNIKIFL